MAVASTTAVHDSASASRSPISPSSNSSFSSSSSIKNWLKELESDPEWQEAELRPWGNQENRKQSGCIGNGRSKTENTNRNPYYILHHPRLLFRLFWSPSLREIRGTVTFTNDTEGPPTGAHGASILSVFDEILAYPVWRSGYTAYTGQLNTQFKRMIPLGSTQKFVARMVDVNETGKKIRAEGKIFGRVEEEKGEDEIFAEATGLWINSNRLGKVKSKL